MIRQTAFEGTQPLLKGGLHCHTTRSDGLLSPEEVIRLHGRYGYDFLALTDHRIYNRTDYAPDSGVLILPGMEMDRLLALPGRRWFHTVCLGRRGTRPLRRTSVLKAAWWMTPKRISRCWTACTPPAF